MTLFNEKMTVYNYYRNETGDETWYRHVIDGIQWSHNKIESTVSGNQIEQSKQESITVNFQWDYGNATYIDPISYAKLTEEQVINYWTLNAENNLDVIVLGECATEITAEYGIDQLQQDNQYAGTVNWVSDNRNRNYLKTIKVGVV